MPTSVEKVEQRLPDLLSGGNLPPMLAMAGPQLMPIVMAQLPQAPPVLDDLLAHLAQELLDMRSDDAQALHVGVEHEAQVDG